MRNSVCERYAPLSVWAQELCSQSISNSCFFLSSCVRLLFTKHLCGPVRPFMRILKQVYMQLSNFRWNKLLDALQGPAILVVGLTPCHQIMQSVNVMHEQLRFTTHIILTFLLSVFLDILRKFRSPKRSLLCSVI